MNRYERYRRALLDYPKPLAFLDLDSLTTNKDRILHAAGSKKVRIVSKSIRCVPLIRHLLATDDRFEGVMCYTVSEALFLSRQGLDDLLVAYPAWERTSLTDVGKEVLRGKKLTLMVDDEEHIARLEEVGQGIGVVFPVCLDMDLSVSWPGLHFGVRRSPIRSQKRLIDVVKGIEKSPSVKLEGIMGYEAQVAGVGDQVPGRPLTNRLMRLLKGHSIRRIAQQRGEWIRELKELGLSLRFVNGGGTGSLKVTSQEDVITEVAAGSGFFSSVLFDHYRDFQGEPAAGFALEITRRPTPGIVTCLGGGYPASGASGSDRLPTPWLPEGAKLLPLEGAGEVQTPVQYEGSFALGLGDPIFFRHAKAGEMCERFTEILVIKGDQVVDRHPTYRGEGKCFL
ncbi:D-serine deaminase, pyridoxal phosphate-dependent [Marininema mesophilum]|uniref:D-serine deaminase, pyridoxal phosphate-dependent n=1 Tax=Marininema mesophilum TaxID=1048340 RepID=A0A1H2SGY2_9BACL|nr:amino acid deaminase/aldolase [Marininema mesophilum]SDW30787.1 D-serine deaminase, pyridoxal phosphate-dependent [Marininema mesophilum]